MAEAIASRTARKLAESYEVCVHSRRGARDMIWHDNKFGCILDFFRAFNRRTYQRQQAAMAFRPQANGTPDRMVQTLTR